MSFGVSFSVCDLPTIALCAALSMVVSALAFALTLVVSAAFVPAGALLCLALPFLELLCLNKCSADLVDKLEFSFMTMPVRTASFVGHLGVPSVVFGVLLGILRCCALTGPLLDLLLAAGGAESAFSFSVFAASLFACAALIMAMLTLRKSRNFAFRVLVPLIAVLLVTLCTPYGTDGTFRCFALFGSYFMLEACLWVMYADIAQSYRVSAFTTFGLRSRPSVRRLPRRFSHAAARRSFGSGVDRTDDAGFGRAHRADPRRCDAAQRRRDAQHAHTRSPLPSAGRPDRLGRADGRGSCRKRTFRRRSRGADAI